MRDTVKPAKPRKLELLAPARDVQVARTAILHGADAVYIGADAFGARAAAGNKVEDIADLCAFAHQWRAKVYATVNTIIYEHELTAARQLVERLYDAGVDAAIVQDMGLLRMKLPPIELHASTQCDTRTPEKARFLQEMGFSQIVLARELTLHEIKEIADSVSVPLEAFVHGALCVSYSGRCHASQALCRRSANRGECAQICRLPYNLTDATGRTLAHGKHLLSLHDFNASHSLEDMIEAGISSFKIEGRLKDEAYVKNITAHYRRQLDRIIDAHPDKYCRASCGKTELHFNPEPCKSFNRGFTSYFLHSRTPQSIASIHTPKSLGEPLCSMADVRNGDGLAFFDNRGEYTGFSVNGMKRNTPVPNRRLQLPRHTQYYRTTDLAWNRLMARNDTASRRIAVSITLHSNRIEATDERGCHVVLPHTLPREQARSPQNLRNYYEKLGDTIYRLEEFDNRLSEKNIFIPASALTGLRRALIEALDSNARATYSHPLRRKENPEARYPSNRLDYRDNVANSLASELYKDHGVKHIEPAMEIQSTMPTHGKTVMTTRHCVLRELGMCLKSKGHTRIKLPLTLTSHNASSQPFKLLAWPDCNSCEMRLTLP